MSKILRYDLIGADMCGVKGHPQEVMYQLGYECTDSEPVPIADCWLFTVDEVIEPLPEYLQIVRTESE